MYNYFVNIVTELDEELTVYVMALDEFDAKEQARWMVENGEVECVGCTVKCLCFLGGRVKSNIFMRYSP